MRIVLSLVICTALATTGTAAPSKPRRPNTSQSSVHKIPNTGVLSAADLVAIARLHLNNGADQFSDDPTLSYVGREFTITIGAGDLSADYNKETHTLKVSTPPYLDGYKLGESVSVSHYVGQNSYGARAAVTKRRGDIFGVWIPGEVYNRVPIVYTTSLEGPAARDLSKSLSLRLSGVITEADGIYAEKDSAIYKKLMYSDATVSDPYEVFIQQYFVSVRFTKAEWIDGRSGDILSTADVGH